MKKRQGVYGCSLCLGLVWSTRSDWRLKESNYARPKWAYKLNASKDENMLGLDNVKVKQLVEVMVNEDIKILEEELTKRRVR